MEERVKFFKDNHFTVTSCERDPSEPDVVWVTVDKEYSDIKSNLDIIQRVTRDMTKYEAEFHKDVIEELMYIVKQQK